MPNIIIVGGGIAGLYCGYKLTKYRPDLTFTILEKDIRRESETHVSAGRLGSHLFKDKWVSCGGGIGMENCKLLLELLDELKIKYNWFSIRQKTNNPDDLRWFKNKVKILTEQCREMNGMTFCDFALNHMSVDEYMRFMYISGYRDYETNDSFHVLNYYGLMDNVDDFRAFSCNWGHLVSALYRILENNICFGTQVLKLNYIDNHIIVDCESVENKYKYVCDVLICATAVDGLMQLFKNPSYHNIAGQSELRLYARIQESSDIRTLTADHRVIKINAMIQKIIPIDRNKNIYMLIYCDNQRADYFSNYIEPTEINKKIIEHHTNNELQTSIKITNMVGFYDRISVHIFKPLSVPIKTFITSVQYPVPRVMAVGEAVALKHGWVESALQSTVRFIPFIKVWFP